MMCEERQKRVQLLVEMEHLAHATDVALDNAGIFNERTPFSRPE